MIKPKKNKYTLIPDVLFSVILQISSIFCDHVCNYMYFKTTFSNYIIVKSCRYICSVLTPLSLTNKKICNKLSKSMEKSICCCILPFSSSNSIVADVSKCNNCCLERDKNHLFENFVQTSVMYTLNFFYIFRFPHANDFSKHCSKSRNCA